MVYTSFRIVA
jgi:hypothetical protein